MFMIIATKSLDDGTAGFRFNILGRKGLVRRRKLLSRGFKIERKKSMVTIHARRLTIYVEHATNPRMLRHFAG
jgi:hypothetical protein